MENTNRRRSLESCQPGKIIAKNDHGPKKNTALEKSVGTGALAWT